jgi:hypothetical protein
MTTTTALANPIFTRYLYEFHQVKNSLQKSILEKKREEALFWAYELYHSGFKEETWEIVKQIYLQYYLEANPKFRTRLGKFYAEWLETGDDCLIGTVVGTLSVWDSVHFGQVSTARTIEDVSSKGNKHFIILYKEDRHKTVPVEYPARNYLKNVSQFAVCPLEKDPYPNYLETSQNAYLGPDWLYYCVGSPIWEKRVREGRGHISGKKIEFETDEQLEDFYDKWGFEPDEQSAEMHKIHGIYLC